MVWRRLNLCRHPKSFTFWKNTLPSGLYWRINYSLANNILSFVGSWTWQTLMLFIKIITLSFFFLSDSMQLLSHRVFRTKLPHFSGIPVCIWSRRKRTFFETFVHAFCLHVIPTNSECILLWPPCYNRLRRKGISNSVA